MWPPAVRPWSSGAADDGNPAGRVDGRHPPAPPAAAAGGYATEAAAVVLDWAHAHGVHVYASIRPPNPASARVLEKIGMRPVDSCRDEDGQRDIYRR